MVKESSDILGSLIKGSGSEFSAADTKILKNNNGLAYDVFMQGLIKLIKEHKTTISELNALPNDTRRLLADPDTQYAVLHGAITVQQIADIDPKNLGKALGAIADPAQKIDPTQVKPSNAVVLADALKLEGEARNNFINVMEEAYQQRLPKAIESPAARPLTTPPVADQPSIGRSGRRDQ